MVKSGRRLSRVLAYAVLTAGLLVICIPFYLAVLTAFKPTAESMNDFFALPSSLYLDNFKTVIAKNNFIQYFQNSVLILVVSIAGILAVVPMTAYTIHKNIGRPYYKVFNALLVAGILIPFQVFMLPMTQQMSAMNLMHQGGLIVLYITYSLTQGVFLYQGYLRTVIPGEIEEAARIDGSGILTTYTRIIFPMMKPMTGTIIILNSLWIWNDFLMPLLVLNRSNSYWTLPLFQYNFKSQYAFEFNLAFATFVLSIAPIIVIYACFQKHIIAGLTSGAIKC